MIRLAAQITFDPPPGKYARRFGQVTRAAHHAGAVWWHATYLPRHFEPAAEGRYGYGPRSAAYLDDPDKKGKPPLVFSGLTRDRATATAQIKAYPTRARITLYAPSYIPQRPRRPNMPRMAEEIFAVRPDEQTQIERVMRRKAEADLRAMREKRTVRIG